MSIGAFRASTGQFVDQRYKNESRFQPDWKRIGQLTGKILLVALVIAAFAVATYFTMGMAIPVFAAGALAWQGGVLMSTGVIGAACIITTPILAAAEGMFRLTKHGYRDCGRFLKYVFLMPLLYTVALVFKQAMGY